MGQVDDSMILLLTVLVVVFGKLVPLGDDLPVSNSSHLHFDRSLISCQRLGRSGGLDSWPLALAAKRLVAFRLIWSHQPAV